MSSRYDIKEYSGAGVTWHSCADELELFEKSLELLKEARWGIGYKKPEDRDKFLLHTTHMDSDIVTQGEGGDAASSALDGIRLTLTPPKPEPKENEWDQAKERIIISEIVVSGDIVRLMNELDKRCPK